jgi:hypothetical protein
MRKFMLGISLVVILSSCTYNTYTVNQDDQPNTEVNRVESKYDDYEYIKNQRDKLIQTCTNKEDSPCFFRQRNGIDHFILVYPNEKEMLSSKEATMKIATAFCSSSTKLSIPAQFHVALDYERVTHDFNCSTATWSEWYSTEKQKNN